jgi:hypothetical protein
MEIFNTAVKDVLQIAVYLEGAVSLSSGDCWDEGPFVRSFLHSDSRRSVKCRGLFYIVTLLVMIFLFPVLFFYHS